MVVVRDLQHRISQVINDNMCEVTMNTSRLLTALLSPVRLKSSFKKSSSISQKKLKIQEFIKIIMTVMMDDITYLWDLCPRNQLIQLVSLLIASSSTSSSLAL